MLIDILKAMIVGLVEGITEWLPISSSTHVELVCALLKTQYSEAFFKVGLCLPSGPCVTEDDVRYIVDTIKRAIL